jgi:hypothetical protein
MIFIHFLKNLLFSLVFFFSPVKPDESKKGVFRRDNQGDMTFSFEDKESLARSFSHVLPKNPDDLKNDFKEPSNSWESFRRPLSSCLGPCNEIEIHDDSYLQLPSSPELIDERLAQRLACLKNERSCILRSCQNKKTVLVTHHFLDAFEPDSASGSYACVTDLHYYGGVQGTPRENSAEELIEAFREKEFTHLVDLKLSHVNFSANQFGKFLRLLRKLPIKKLFLENVVVDVDNEYSAYPNICLKQIESLHLIFSNPIALRVMRFFNIDFFSQLKELSLKKQDPFVSCLSEIFEYVFSSEKAFALKKLTLENFFFSENLKEFENVLSVIFSKKRSFSQIIFELHLNNELPFLKNAFDYQKKCLETILQEEEKQEWFGQFEGQNNVKFHLEHSLEPEKFKARFLVEFCSFTAQLPHAVDLPE